MPGPATTVELSVLRAGYAEVQDLGRPGLGVVGIPPRGAADQASARTAHVLAGNREDAPLIEVTGSELALTAPVALLVAATGAAEVHVDGHRQPAWETLVVAPGATLSVRVVEPGFRAYLAVNGELEAPSVLGSAAPDPLLGAGDRLETGGTLRLSSRFTRIPGGTLGPVFRFGLTAPSYAAHTIRATPGPDLDRLAGGAAALERDLRVLPDSDQVGLRLAARLTMAEAGEIVSRGVPVGAVEVPPSGELLVLLRGRLVTAGYPVVAVVTTESLDRLGQVRPGTSLRLRLCDVATAHDLLRRQAAERAALAGRVREAFRTSGIGDCLPRV